MAWSHLLLLTWARRAAGKGGRVVGKRDPSERRRTRWLPVNLKGTVSPPRLFSYVCS